MKHVYRVMLLIAAALLWLGWTVKHSEPNSNVGLRYIQQAEQIDQGDWRDGLARGIDHPLHPLLVAATHHLVGGQGPGSWQRAALVLCFASALLLVIPVYLLALELFGGQAAWLACVLAIGNPIVGSIVVNVLSESTFLFWWTFGLWASVRFLREGWFLWLPLAAGFGGLAYLTRPEGMLLPVALAATLLILPLLRTTQINWPRWWRALAFLIAGLAFVVGPYIAVKGGLATKPPIARVLGFTPQAQPLALEREAPLPPGQTALETYRLAAIRVLEVFRDAVTLPLVPFAVLGMVLAAWQPARVRAALFLGDRAGRLGGRPGPASCHRGILYPPARYRRRDSLTTGGRSRDDRDPEQVSRFRADGSACRDERLRPGPAVWAVLLVLLIVPVIRDLGPFNPGPYSVYHTTGEWLANNTPRYRAGARPDRLVALFQPAPGYNFADCTRRRRPAHALDRGPRRTDGRASAVRLGHHAT